MAWVDIPNSDVDPESPITTALVTALRDNPIAIANRDAGAPVIDHPTATAGSLPDIISPDEISETSATYVKVKEVYYHRDGIVSTSFDLHSNTAGTAYGQIYINGSPVGTERSTNSTTYLTYTEDILVSKNDLVQIYAKHQFSNVTNIRDFIVSSANPTAPSLAL